MNTQDGNKAQELATIIIMLQFPDFKVIDVVYHDAAKRHEVKCHYTGADKVWRDTEGVHHYLTHNDVIGVTWEMWPDLRSTLVNGVERKPQ